MTPSKVYTALKLMCAIDKPVMIWGPPGIGKSDIVRLLARNMNRKVFDIRLALLDPTDLRGIPYFDPETKTAKWGQASMLPTEADGPSILFLDEINAAPPSIQAAAYQLVLDRRIGEYIVPKNTFIVAAGNKETDKGVTHAMPTPLLNRFTHIEFEVSANDWLVWAEDQSIHPDIVGFISHSKASLHKFNPSNCNERGFPTPRSWASVSSIIYGAEETGLDEDRVFKELISGTIGEGMTAEFFAHRDIAKFLPHPKDVLDGKEKKLSNKVKDEISAHYTMIIRLMYEMSELNKSLTNNQMDNFLVFIDENFSPEFCTYSLNKIMHNEKIPDEVFRDCKMSDKIINKYVQYV